MSIFIRSNNKIYVAVIKTPLIIILLLAGLISTVNGQTITGPTNTHTPLALTPGVPAGTRIEDFANINLFNGNLNFALPLASAGGRGELSIPVTLTIERHWQVNTRCDVTNSGMLSCSKFVASMWWGDLQVGYGPGVLQARGGSNCGTAIPQAASQYPSPIVFTFTDANGTEHELRDQLTNGVPDAQCNGHARGRTFSSVDGSSITFTSDTDTNDNTPITTGTGYLMMRDGTHFRIEDGLVKWIRDRKGNTINYDYEIYEGYRNRIKHITDALGHQITINYDVNDPQRGICDQIILPGVGTSRTITITKTALGNVLRPDQSPQPKTYGQLFPEINLLNSSSQFNPSTIVSAVYLPNGQSYKFYYNSYGELARIELPTGGAVEYDYQGGLTNGADSGSILSNNYIYRRVVTKRAFIDALNTNSLLSTTTYSRPESYDGQYYNILTTGYVTVDQRNANNGFLSYEKHYFYGASASSFNSQNPYASWKEGKEHRTEIFDVNRETVLRRVTHTWRQRDAVSWWNQYAAAAHLNPDDEPSNDPRVVEVITAIEPTGANLVTRQTIGYSNDIHNNQTDVWEYDYGIGTWPSYPLRHSHTDYLTVNPANNINYAGPANGSTYTGADPHLRSLPSSQRIYSVNPTNGTETLITQSEAQYDQSNYPSLTYGTVTGWGDPGAARGNKTTVRSWLNTSDTWLETHAQYDQCGSVRNTWDAKGNESQISYSSAYAYAYPTSTTSPDPDGAGPMSPLTVSTDYDSSTGLVTATIDSNGQRTTFAYNDSMNRLTQVVSAAGDSAVKNQTTYAYDDNGHTVTKTSDLNSYGDNLLKTQAIYDGLGRTTETRQYETATSFITSRQEFDALSRVKRAYNPYRSTTDNTYGWTDITYDALSRMKSAQTFGLNNASTGIMQTDYIGNQVLVTDQAGKQRLSQTNALGQLTDVWEITPNNPANYLGIVAVSFSTQNLTGFRTQYEYDSLDNLTKVIQGTQQRVFVYNSLKQLKEATNPESGHLSYDYDLNGNLKQKTDARNIIVNYEYDELSRVISKTYQNDGGLTPPVYYKYDSQNLPTGAPEFDRGSSGGRLVAVLYGNATSTTGTYLGYDPLGRVKRSIQRTNDGQSDQTYTFENYDYDLAGDLKSEKYPSGRIVLSEYGQAGRLTGVKSQGSATYYTGTGANDPEPNNQIQYTAHGAVKAMKLGNGLWEHTVFNSRLQPTEIGLGTTPGGIDRLKLNYSYGGTDNNGNVESQTINVPSIGPATSLTVTQSYGYDALNRLLSAEEVNSTTQVWKQTYKYDRFGNRRFKETETTLPVIDQGNKNITNPNISESNNKISDAGYRYDAAGNLECDPVRSCNPATQAPYYEYDANNKMIKNGGGANSNNTTSASYYYDGDGKRVKRVFGSTYTIFVYDAMGQLIAEYSNSSSSGSGTSYVTSDMLGTPRVITGSNINDQWGGIKSRHDYLPFGEEVIVGRNSSYIDDNVRQKFTQYERDVETGLDYTWARYYSSQYGRFQSSDPYWGSADASIPQSWNRYAYCLNRPFTYVDPSGLTWLRGGPNDQIYWVEDAIYEKYKNNFKNYKVIPDGTVLNFKTIYAEKYKYLEGDYVTLNANGTISHVDIQEAVEIRDNGGAAIDFSPNAALNQSLLFCKRNAEFDWNYFGIKHWWLKTQEKEAGAGEAVPGQGKSSSEMKITDQSGEALRDVSWCNPLTGYDVDRVNSQLHVGNPIGTFGIFHNCQTTVRKVLKNSIDKNPDLSPFLQ